MKNKVILAGGSGYLGTVLADYYKTRVKEVVIFTRSNSKKVGNTTFVNWNGKTIGDWHRHLENADLLINLTGKNVNCRYTKKNKQEILSSRVDATRVLGEAILKVNNPPKLWVQCASATIYRHAEDRPMDEVTGEIGNDFSETVCKQWEGTYNNLVIPGIRKVVLRVGIVLGNRGGAFPRLVNLVKFGLGGKQGYGKQMVTWIHEDDVIRIIDWIDQHEELQGTFNCTSTGPLSNTSFMKALRHAYGKSFGLPSPAWLLEAGAVFIGTETELILKSRWVVPAKLLKTGFTFKFSRVEDAFKDLLG